MQPTITCKELAGIINNPNVIVLDASQNNVNETIEGAIIFDIKNRFSDTHSPFPNTLPKKEHFEKECQLIGISSTSEIIVYDNKGVYSSPRVWFMFRAMGHKNIKVLNGGLPAWKAEGFETLKNNQEQKRIEGSFKATSIINPIIHFDDVCSNIDTKKFKLIDARSKGRFNGNEPEPRKEIPSGNIPSSINLPYTEVLDNGAFKNKEELKEVFNKKVSKTLPLVFSCGSGITACILLLAYYIAFKKEATIYDGSWTEWAIKNKL